LRFIRPCAGAKSHKRLKPEHRHSTNPIGKTCTLAEFRQYSDFQKKIAQYSEPTREIWDLPTNERINEHSTESKNTYSQC